MVGESYERIAGYCIERAAGLRKTAKEARTCVTETEYAKAMTLFAATCESAAKVFDVGAAEARYALQRQRPDSDE